ncbi:hypothetical protein [Streptomyces sp. NPDC089799]|uniref:hypothetical protein n=1 Tax=Streptomyces sp. NPDC089799 TaxID=3155066 RepID=UPI003439F1C7
MATLATATLAAVLTAPATPASASAFCDQTTPNTSLFFYKKSTGEAGTGTLSAGRWRYRGSLSLPAGYTHAAASRDSLLLYNANTGEGESGTFTGGRYQRVQTYDNFATGWTQLEASGDSVLAYNSGNGRGGSGTLKNGRYREVRAYDNFSTGWASMAASCDTLVATTARRGSTEFPESNVGFGTLRGGVYRNTGNRDGDVFLGTLIATRNSVMGLAKTSSTQLTYKVTTAAEGDVGQFEDIGTSGVWNTVGRTADSLFFYKTDGTAWTSTLNNGTYRNVGPLSDVSPGWTIIEGGV